MKRDRRLLVAVALTIVATAALVGLWVEITTALVSADLGEAERRVIIKTLTPRIPLVVLTALMLTAIVVYIVQAVYRHWVEAAARLLERTEIVLSTDGERELPAEGAAELRGLARAINELARQRRELRHDVESKVSEASRSIEQERNRLAALMSELTQSVVACNLDGRILLYNYRARLQARALSAAPALADGAELIGLGRSIYSVLDRRLVAHALDNIRQRLARGAASPTAQFVTFTRSGQLLRVQMAPVRAAEQGTHAAHDEAVSGFVLVLDNITREYERESERDRLLHSLTESTRASLASLRAAAERLDDVKLDPAQRDRLLDIVRADTAAMSSYIEQFAARATHAWATRWPLEEMLGADLVTAAQRRIGSQLGLPARAEDADASLWLKVDSFSLLQAIVYLAARLRDEHRVDRVRLRLTAPDAAHVQLDLAWPGPLVDSETVLDWETAPMRIGNESDAVTLGEVVDRHGAEFRYGLDRARDEAFFRFLLPRAADTRAHEPRAPVRTESRPEFYDFDLFSLTEASRALDERALTDLSYTVFDTETTGLQPSAGDAIIQIGAVRVVNGKVLRAEAFEQLVDPQRPITPASIPIHGITPAMVAGQPTIDVVVPALFAYAHDTVLVAHNAAFDMRFLQLAEAASGVHFDQPVLDTLLLSAVVHPNQDSHSLEAIAERFDVPVLGRHTALGDAIATAEVFLRLIPLLADKGIVTLGQARAAARKSYLARVAY